MQVEIRIDNHCTEPKIIIVTKEINDEINALMKKLSDDQINRQGETMRGWPPESLPEWRG